MSEFPLKNQKIRAVIKNYLGILVHVEGQTLIKLLESTPSNRTTGKMYGSI